MLATELALAVSYPSAGNIGGGGFMVYRKSDGSTGALDYRERAPMISTRDMYLDENKNVIKGLSMIGGLSVGVPGTIAGIFEAHKEHGTMTINELISPVIELAKKGYCFRKTKTELKKIENILKLLINQKYFLMMTSILMIQ